MILKWTTIRVNTKYQQVAKSKGMMLGNTKKDNRVYGKQADLIQSFIHWMRELES